MGNVTPARIVECGSYPLLFSNVINGMGVAMVPLSHVEACCRNEQVRIYPLHGTYASLTYEFVFFDHPGKPAPRDLAQMIVNFEKNPAHPTASLATA